MQLGSILGGFFSEEYWSHWSPGKKIAFESSERRRDGRGFNSAQ
jgi:hypothetical protein